MFLSNLGEDENYLLENDQNYFNKKLAFAKVFGYIGFIAYLAYSIANYFYGDFWASGLELVLWLIIVYATYDLYRYKRINLASGLGIATGMIILWQNVYSGGFAGTGYFWLFIWPLLTFMLGGVKRAQVLNLIFYAGLVILFIASSFGLTQWEYPPFTIFMIFLTLTINILLLNSFQANIESYVRQGIENRKKIEELNSVRDKFIDIVSLQISSPLNAIRWNSELLKDDVKGEAKDRVQDIYSSASLLVNKLTDMKFAVDIKQEAISLTIKQFDLVDIVKNLLSEMSKSFPDKNVELDILGFSKGNLISSDPEKVSAIISIILDNAFRYTIPDGNIKVTLVASDGRITFTVEDDGTGIPAAEIPHVFDLFVRGSNANQLNPYGTGVGLYVARYFANQLDILLDLTSKENKGTNVSLHFADKVNF